MNVPLPVIEEPAAPTEPLAQPGLFGPMSRKTDNNRSTPQRRRHHRAPIPVMLSVPIADAERVNSVSNHFATPKLIGGTLFLDADVPGPQWKAKLDTGRVDEVYVILSPEETEKDIAFAHSVLMHMRSKHRGMPDPVVVGPVTPVIASQWYAKIEDAGLDISESEPRQYARQLASVRARTAARRPTHRRR